MSHRPWPTDDELGDDERVVDVGIPMDDEGEETQSFEIPVSPEAAPEVCNVLTNVLMQMGFSVEPAFKDNNGRLLVLLLDVSAPDGPWAPDDDDLQPST